MIFYIKSDIWKNFIMFKEYLNYVYYNYGLAASLTHIFIYFIYNQFEKLITFGFSFVSIGLTCC